MNPSRVRSAQLKSRARIAKVGNKYIYDHLPRLDPGQIETLRQNPEMMDAMINKLGLKVVQVLMNQHEQAPAGLVLDEGRQNG